MKALVTQLKISGLSGSFCLLGCLMVGSVTSQAGTPLPLEFSEVEVMGRTFTLTDNVYPTCVFDLVFKPDYTFVGPGGYIANYMLDNGVIVLSGAVSFSATLSVLARTDLNITAEFSSTGSGFVAENNWSGVDFSVMNNSAENLKDWFISNGFWPGYTVTPDGRITEQSATYDGSWWIADNTFYFQTPDPGGCVDSKAYKLVNDVLMFATDATHVESYTMVNQSNGDINEDGQINASDVLLGQQILSGLISATPEQIIHMDIAPSDGTYPLPDGLLTAGDLLLIQKKLFGL